MQADQPLQVTPATGAKQQHDMQINDVLPTWSVLNRDE
jgi:hypothetical protein